MKVLSLNGLKTLTAKLKADAIPTETNYYVEITGSTSTYTVPGYVNGKSYVEVYINGFKLVPGQHYNISTAGVITLVNKVHEGGNYLHVLQRKYK